MNKEIKYYILNDFTANNHFLQFFKLYIKKDRDVLPILTKISIKTSW